jgi:hypothetical protein
MLNRSLVDGSLILEKAFNHEVHEEHEEKQKGTA